MFTGNLQSGCLIEITDKLNLIGNIVEENHLIKKMRELDNTVKILESGINICNLCVLNNECFDYVITFSYGGIAIGFILISILKVKYKYSTLPKLIICSYSSKNKLRKNKEQQSLIDSIPYVFNKEKMEIIKGNKSILIYDNNATTFSTLKDSKDELLVYGNDVHCAVEAVYYVNIAKYLMDKKDCEPLVHDWYSILDFHPVEPYITSFNTWGTCEKHLLLEKLFKKNINCAADLDDNTNNEKKEFIFKVCRVQNIYDLKACLNIGVNAIGIHAVYNDKEKYFESEKSFLPKIENCERYDLPTPDLEIESIKQMQQYIPEYVKKVIVFEKSISLHDIKRVVDLYEIKDNLYLQFQCKINNQLIEDIKRIISKPIIATIGLEQEDFLTYLKYLSVNLDANSDYILLDMSKHQPQLINSNLNSYENKSTNIKFNNLKNYVFELKKCNIPILLADDILPEEMKIFVEFLNYEHVNLAGVDMQNNVEFPKNMQKYSLLKDKDNTYQIKIRKSVDLLSEWKGVFK